MKRELKEELEKAFQKKLKDQIKDDGFIFSRGEKIEIIGVGNVVATLIGEFDFF